MKKGIVICIEISQPFQARPGYFGSSLFKAVYWLWFSVGVQLVPRDEYLKRLMFLSENKKLWSKYKDSRGKNDYE